MGGGGYVQNSTVRSDNHLEINWSCGGLISVILIVLSTVNLQCQGRFVPISLKPVLRIVAFNVMATVWSSCS